MNTEALLPIVITILGTLLAVGVGAMFQRRSEHQKWLRETRLHAYSKLLQAGSSYFVSREDLRGIEYGSLAAEKDLGEAQQQAIRANTELEFASQEAMLVASPEAAPALLRFMEASAGSDLAALSEAHANLVDAGRKDMGLPLMSRLPPVPLG